MYRIISMGRVTCGRIQYLSSQEKLNFYHHLIRRNAFGKTTVYDVGTERFWFAFIPPIILIRILLLLLLLLLHVHCARCSIGKSFFRRSEESRLVRINFVSVVFPRQSISSARTQYII